MTRTAGSVATASKSARGSAGRSKSTLSIAPSATPAAASAPVPERIILVVPFDLRRLSPNKTHRMHWAVLMGLKRGSARFIVAAYRVAGQPKMAPPVRLTLIVRRGRRIDDDTAISAMKWVRDSLATCLGYKSDGPNWMSMGEVRYECGKRWKDAPQFELWIEPRGD